MAKGISKPKPKSVPLVCSSKMKALRKEQNELRAELGALQAQRESTARRLKEVHNGLRVIGTKIKAMSSDDITVTDHALLRFLERVEGLDIEAVKDRIVTEALREQVKTLGGTGKFPIDGGCRAVMDNLRIVTVVPA